MKMNKTDKNRDYDSSTGKRDFRSSDSKSDLQQDSRGILFGLAGGMLWAVDSVILSMALAPYEMIWMAPVVATFIHDSISALILILLQIAKKKLGQLLHLLTMKEGRWLIFAGLLGGPVGMSGYVFCIRYAGPGLSAVFSCLYPAFGLLLSFLLFHERFSKRQILGLILSLSGVIALSAGSAQSDNSNLLIGLVFGLVCALGWALEGLVAQKSTESQMVSSDQALTIRQITSSITFGLILVPLLDGWPLTSQIIMSPDLKVIALAAIAGTASYLCYYKAIHLIGASKAMPLNITYSGWAIVFSLLLLGSIPTFLEIAAAIIILAGALMCSSK
ncbi:DMT family transporter [Ileibacterium valens]|uniref:DMT family transporter n=2 Tax=Ileibacterium valens TaxID=1862668 RepID=UPI0009F854D3|nr:DMT family transporter [Ileibacterium valens]